MQRREFIVAVTSVTVAAATAPQASARAPAAPPASIEPPIRRGRHAALETAAGECIDTAEECLRQCFGILASNDTSMAACAEAAYELIAACRALRTLTAANSAHVAIFAKAVEQTCIACRKECEKFSEVAECTACGEACAKCAAECRSTA